MIRCKFSFPSGYTCGIESQVIPSQVYPWTFEGIHQFNRTNDSVESIHISHSTVPKIPKGLDQVFSYITKLLIYNSNLKEISKNDLRQFPYLTHLDLFTNQIEEFSRNLFEFNKRLRYIDLRSNRIQIIDSGLLDNLLDLEKFYISDNCIESVPGDLFKFNKKMKEIRFSKNQIKFIGPELLDGLYELTFVDFKENRSIDMEYNKERDEPQKLIELKQKIKSLNSGSVVRSPGTVLVQGLSTNFGNMSLIQEGLNRVLLRDDVADVTMTFTRDQIRFKVTKK